MDLKNIISYEKSDIDDLVAVLCDDNCLYLTDFKLSKYLKITELTTILNRDLELKMYFCHPYICISERFGLNAVVVNIDNCKLIELSRENDDCDISSYSIAFIKTDNKIHLIHQTQWNRLDIMDLETEEIITKREVKYDYNRETKVDNSINYIDYFHSLLIASPDYNNFIDNGWVWHPIECMYLFNVQEFIKKYELSKTYVDVAGGFLYEDGFWDRPCTFINNDEFIVIAPNISSSIEVDMEYTKNNNEEFELGNDYVYEYKPLAFFNINDSKSKNLKPYKHVKCSIFKTENDIVSSTIYFDKSFNLIIIIKENSAYIVTLDGEIIKIIPSISHESKADTHIIDLLGKSLYDWKYDISHQSLYRLAANSKSFEIFKLTL